MPSAQRLEKTLSFSKGLPHTSDEHPIGSSLNNPRSNTSPMSGWHQHKSRRIGDDGRGPGPSFSGGGPGAMHQSAGALSPHSSGSYHFVSGSSGGGGSCSSSSSSFRGGSGHSGGPGSIRQSSGRASTSRAASASGSNSRIDPALLAKALAAVESHPPDGALILNALTDPPEDCCATLRRLLSETHPCRGLRLEAHHVLGAPTDAAAAHVILHDRETASQGKWARTFLTPFAQAASGSGLCAHLTSLTLHGLPLVGVTALSPLGDLTRPRALRIEESPHLPTEGLRELQLLTSLQLLSLNGCRSVDSQCVGFAMVMPELHALHLDDTACNDVALLTATVLPKLCRLHARRTKISDHGLRVLSKRASLTDLAVGGCEELTDEGIMHLATQLHLQRLDVAGCPGTTKGTLSTTSAKPCRVAASTRRHRSRRRRSARCGTVTAPSLLWQPRARPSRPCVPAAWPVLRVAIRGVCRTCVVRRQLA